MGPYLRLFILALISSLTSAFVFLLAHYCNRMRHYPNTYQTLSQPHSQHATSSHRVLIICTNKNMGGGEIHALNFYKTLVKKGVATTFLTTHNALLKQELLNNNLPFYTCDAFRISGKFFNRYFSFQPGLEQAIDKICKKHDISIIHCNDLRETAAAHKIALKIPVKIVYTRHIPDHASPLITRSIDGIIGVSTSITDMLEKEKNVHHFTHQKVTCIQPFFDEKKFLNFTPTSSRKDFFQQNFNETIKENMPIMCMIGHYYEDKRKNHELLLKALQKLVHEKNKPLQIAFAGNGIQEACQTLIKQYNIQDFVYFLGNTDKTPGLLFHSDINILPSFKDAFPITILEGTLMKKPTIVSSVIGPAGTLIVHKQTGLVFENNNLDSLVENIELFLDNPKLAKQLGENAYNHALKNYSNQIKLEQLITFYDTITQTK